MILNSQAAGADAARVEGVQRVVKGFDYLTEAEAAEFSKKTPATPPPKASYFVSTVGQLALALVMKPGMLRSHFD
jgi:hypothetical protein